MAQEFGFIQFPQHLISFLVGKHRVNIIGICVSIEMHCEFIVLAVANIAPGTL